MKIRKNHRGFSLIEVMIALVIVAVGALGIAKLQGVLVKNSSDANQRTVAVAIAQKKIDDLRSFVHLNVGTNTDEIPDVWEKGIASKLLSYTHIANPSNNNLSTYTGTGGTITPASTDAPITVGNYSYTLDWDVTDYWYVSALSAPTMTQPSPAPSHSDMKAVIVTVSWLDEQGASQKVSLNTVVEAYSPAVTALSDNSGPGAGAVSPLATYVPELAPDVIDVDVDTGEGQFRQTSKPLPDAVKTGADANTLVSFEVVTYHETSENSDEFIADIKEEFVTVDCKCQFTGNGIALPPAHVVWDDEDNTRSDYLASYINKPVASQVDNANAVDEICTICCRDHHDVTSTEIAPKVRFDGQTIASGDHAHYQSDGTTLAVQASNHIYVESCRFKRIDGIMRAFQDWSLKSLTVMNRADLVEGSQLQDDYATYVQELVFSHYGVSTVPSKPALRTPIYSAVGTKQQLESRGVYIDKVYEVDSYGNFVESTAHLSYISDPDNLDRLEKTPFSEVNLTLLSLWDSSSTDKATVTSEDVATISDPDNTYYGTYSRGWIDALAATDVSGVDITSQIKPNNDGITQLNIHGVSTVDDTVNVRISAAAANVTVTGILTLVDAPGGVKVTMNSPECTFDSGSSGPYTCSIPSGTNLSISITAYKKNTCDVPAGILTVLGVESSQTGKNIMIDCVP